MNQLLVQMLWIIPSFIVGIVGLVLAVSKWSRHPQASLLVTLGISVLLISAVAQVTTYALIIPRIAATQTHASIPAIYGIANFLFSLLHQSGILLLILAAFANRQTPIAPPVR